MARARNIKPGFFLDDKLGELDPLARILFAGLWCIADREGRLNDRPKRIKIETLPYDDCDIDALLESLADAGFILRYENQGNKYICIKNFLKHQNPHNKEAESTIPAPLIADYYTSGEQKELEQHSTSTVQVQDLHSTNPADSLNPHPLTFNPHTDTLSSPVPAEISSSKEDGAQIKSGKDGYSSEFIEFWDAYPRKKEKAKAYRAWKARLKEHVSCEDMTKAASNYALDCSNSGTEEKYIKLPSTFIGPDKPFQDYVNWTLPQSKAVDTAVRVKAKIPGSYSNQRRYTATELAALEKTLLQR